MSDRKEALENLLAKLEAGDDLSGNTEFWAAAETAFKRKASDVANMAKAFYGSLDAAKAIDEAIPTTAIMSAEDAMLILFGRDGARHWLAWKIRALIAEEEA